jgi:alpha-glucosidase
VGVWVYVNQHALQKQAEEIFPIYKEWGLSGIKFGFVQFTSQHWADWVHRMVRLAAENNLMVNIHDEYRPVGYSRTYPNLLTQEGIRGNEEFPSATHNTILPFTRMICGAGDYTVCYFDPRLKNTHAHQLTFPVMYFSPLQTLYWYDTPDRIKEVPELEFFDNVPVVWDETKVVDDAIGEHVVIARRSGEQWFAGAITNDDGRILSVSTDFLETGKDYVLRVYTDDPESDSPTKVKSARYIVKGGQALTFNLQPKGGAAMHFIPAAQADVKAYKRLKTKAVL